MDIYITLYRKKRRAAAIIKRSVENAGNDQPEGADAFAGDRPAAHGYGANGGRPGKTAGNGGEHVWRQPSRSAHLLCLVEAAAAGVRSAGGNPARYFATDICDGMAQGHDGINYSLASREIIADAIEIHGMATPFDATVYIASCDKGLPANLMASGRLNTPGIFVPGRCDGCGAGSADAGADRYIQRPI